MAKKEALTLRAKIVGVILRDARLASGKSMKECGAALGISSGAYSSYERGVKGISLPELEILAYYLDLPLAHFLSDRLLEEDGVQAHNGTVMLELRHRIIGALLRQARLEQDLTQKQVAKAIGIPTSRLQAYEFGERPIPLPELELLARELGLRIEDLVEKTGPVGQWVTVRQASEDFSNLSPELQEFVTQPNNEPYLRLAVQLAAMPADRLRGIAEGLLDITL